MQGISYTARQGSLPARKNLHNPCYHRGLWRQQGWRGKRQPLCMRRHEYNGCALCMQLHQERSRTKEQAKCLHASLNNPCRARDTNYQGYTCPPGIFDICKECSANTSRFAQAGQDLSKCPGRVDGHLCTQWISCNEVEPSGFMHHSGGQSAPRICSTWTGPSEGAG